MNNNGIPKLPVDEKIENTRPVSRALNKHLTKIDDTIDNGISVPLNGICQVLKEISDILKSISFTIQKVSNQ